MRGEPSSFVIGGRGRVRSIPLSCVLIVVASAAASQVAAQEPPAEGASEPAGLFGTVLEKETGAPVFAAQVYLPVENIGFVTDSLGWFHLPDIRPGTHPVSVERVGYAPLDTEVTVSDPAEPVELQVLRDPIVLSGLEVVTDRFERRRLAAPTSVRVYGEERLRTAAFDMVEFLRMDAALPVFRCPDRMLAWDCILVRGRLQPPLVYIDEMRAVGGLDQLAMLQPHDVHMVEVFGRGRHIRVYTHRFMERAARARLTPIPLFW